MSFIEDLPLEKQLMIFERHLAKLESGEDDRLWLRTKCRADVAHVKREIRKQALIDDAVVVYTLISLPRK